MVRQRLARLIALTAVICVLATLIRGSEAAKFGIGSGLPKASPIIEPFLVDLQERTFRFFWDTANPKNGLVPDRYPTPSFSSVAAVGFALTSYPVGVERAYVTRPAARQRVLATLRFFRNAAQGPDARFQQALFVLRGVVFEVLRQVAVLTRRFDRLNDGCALRAFELGKLRG